MSNPHVQFAEQSIKAYGWSSMFCDFHSEHQVGPVKLTVCTASVCTPEMAVFDAIVVTGGGMTNCCNLSMFPTLDDALAYHVGKLVLEGGHRIVSG